MLKLTKCHWDKDQIIPGQPVWIAPQHVQSIKRHHRGTRAQGEDITRRSA
jgi:hypothetical protein